MPAEVFKLKTNEDPFYPAVFEGEDYRCGARVKLKISEDNPKDDLFDALVMYAAEFDALNLRQGDRVRFRVASISEFVFMYRDKSAQPDVCLIIKDIEIIRPSVVTELRPKANPLDRPRTL